MHGWGSRSCARPSGAARLPASGCATPAAGPEGLPGCHKPMHAQLHWPRGVQDNHKPGGPVYACPWVVEFLPESETSKTHPLHVNTAFALQVELSSLVVCQVFAVVLLYPGASNFPVAFYAAFRNLVLTRLPQRLGLSAGF